MISRLRGTLLSRTEERIEVATAGGVVYEVEVPLSVAERLPGVGEELELRTVQVVREDLHALYGFTEPGERLLFQRLLGASGVGARLALAMLSTFPATRLVRALVERDVAALTQVSGVGKKTAERLILELSDRVKELDLASEVEAGGPAEGARAAVQALTALGMSFQEADAAVRAALDDDQDFGTDELVRRALARK
jgi:holliday junction DNA helicase RuvA